MLLTHKNLPIVRGTLAKATSNLRIISKLQDFSNKDHDLVAWGIFSIDKTSFRDKFNLYDKSSNIFPLVSLQLSAKAFPDYHEY